MPGSWESVLGWVSTLDCTFPYISEDEGLTLSVILQCIYNGFLDQVFKNTAEPADAPSGKICGLIRNDYKKHCCQFNKWWHCLTDK